MTEGPEATYLSTYISKHFKNKHLKKVLIRNGRYSHHGSPPGFKEFVRALPLQLLAVYKKGKILCLLFDNDWCILVRLGMTGWFSKPEHKPLFASNANIVFHFDHADLEFFDVRNFGTLTFTQDLDFVQSELDRLAPDILDPKSTPSRLIQQMSTLDIPTKQLNQSLDIALMDQTFLISGVGNIIKSELLYDAKLSPKRLVRSLTKSEWQTLYQSARTICRKVLRNLENRGLDLDAYFKMHAIYQKEKDPNGFTVKKYKSADGRTTYWVPDIQK